MSECLRYRYVSILHKRTHPRSTLPHPPHLTFPPPSLPSGPDSPFRPRISSDMSDQSASSHLNVLFGAALQDYERQTGIALAKHPLAERLHQCDSVESITVVLHERTQAFHEFFRGKETVMKLLKNAVSVLYNLSACIKLGEVTVIGVVHLKALMGSFITLTLIP